MLINTSQVRFLESGFSFLIDDYFFFAMNKNHPARKERIPGDTIYLVQDNS